MLSPATLAPPRPSLPDEERFEFILASATVSVASGSLLSSQLLSPCCCGPSQHVLLLVLLMLGRDPPGASCLEVEGFRGFQYRFLL